MAIVHGQLVVGLLVMMDRIITNAREQVSDVLLIRTFY